MPADWEMWREVRLRSLRTDPDAFGSAWQRERDFTERALARASHHVVRRGGARARRHRRPGAADPVGVLGMGGLFASAPGETTVVAMWVPPASRGRGVGRAVLEHLLSAAPPGDRLGLWVADGNPAERLYRALGFEPTGAREPIRPGATLMKSELQRPRRPGGPARAAAGG